MSDFPIIEIPPEEVKKIGEKSASVTVANPSAIYSDPQKRAEMMRVDYLCGHLGQYAGVIWRYGEPSNYFEHVKRCKWGDGGFDLPNTKVDFKASMMRGSQNPWNYRLAVRKKDIRKGWSYVLCLVERFTIPDIYNQTARVHLAGWAQCEDLPKEPEKSGVFAGAFTLKVPQLHRLIPLG